MGQTAQAGKGGVRLASQTKSDTDRIGATHHIIRSLCGSRILFWCLLASLVAHEEYRNPLRHGISVSIVQQHIEDPLCGPPLRDSWGSGKFRKRKENKRVF